MQPILEQLQDWITTLIDQKVEEKLQEALHKKQPDDDYIDFDHLYTVVLNKKVSKSTLRLWIRKGRFGDAVSKVGRRILFNKTKTMEALSRIKPYQRSSEIHL